MYISTSAGDALPLFPTHRPFTPDTSVIKCVGFPPPSSGTPTPCP